MHQYTLVCTGMHQYALVYTSMHRNSLKYNICYIRTKWYALVCTSMPRKLISGHSSIKILKFLNTGYKNDN